MSAANRSILVFSAYDNSILTRRPIAYRLSDHQYIDMVVFMDYSVQQLRFPRDREWSVYLCPDTFCVYKNFCANVEDLFILYNITTISKHTFEYVLSVLIKSCIYHKFIGSPIVLSFLEYNSHVAYGQCKH